MRSSRARVASDYEHITESYQVEEEEAKQLFSSLGCAADNLFTI